MNIVIIEDEQLTASDLAATIKKAEPGAEIIDMPESVRAAVSFFKNNQTPLDLIFCDIQLGDGLSFEIFQEVSVQTPIIFCTAYDEYALNAFEVSSIHYMLKPFSLKTVSEALNKFRNLKSTLAQSSPQYETILQLLGRRKSLGSILIHQNDKIVPVKMENIALFYIDNENTYLVTFRKDKHPINKTLEELEDIAGDSFYRVNRQFLVNRKAIRDTSQYFGRKLAINLNIPFDEKVTVSKTRVSGFLDWLSQS